MKELPSSLKQSHEFDVVLVNPGDARKVHQNLADTMTGVEPPYMTGMFASYLKQKGWRVEIVDMLGLNIDSTLAAKIIAPMNPKLVAIAVYGCQPSASTQNMPSAEHLSTELHWINPNIPVLMTGTHPAALPELTLKQTDAKYVCSGEGPQTIHHLLEHLCGRTEIKNVPDLYYWDANKPKFTYKGTLIENLDAEIPGTCWDLLPMARYRAHNWHAFARINHRQPYASIHTTLGCPFKCSFCCINAPFGGSSYRKWSAQRVVQEIDILVKEYGVKNIKFVDEMFILDKRHVLAICDLLIERNYDLNIWAYGRVDTVSKDLLPKLKAAGIKWIALGIESGSKHVRDGVEKGRFDTPDILKVVRDIQDAGINIIGNFIFGLPDDTLESMQQTLDLAIEANCEYVNFYCAMPYPGSKLYEWASKKGVCPTSWLGYSQHSYECQPLPTDHLTAREVLSFRDKAFQIYFKNPKYLQKIRSKFGQKVVEHIEEMLKIELPRRLLEK